MFFSDHQVRNFNGHIFWMLYARGQAMEKTLGGDIFRLNFSVDWVICRTTGYKGGNETGGRGKGRSLYLN